MMRQIVEASRVVARGLRVDHHRNTELVDRGQQISIGELAIVEPHADVGRMLGMGGWLRDTDTDRRDSLRPDGQTHIEHDQARRGHGERSASSRCA